MAGVKGLEPSTYRVTGDRSNQLSYTPVFWWAVKDSNLWPPRCKRDALPTELTAQNQKVTCFISFRTCRSRFITLQKRLKNLFLHLKCDHSVIRLFQIYYLNSITCLRRTSLYFLFFLCFSCVDLVFKQSN